MELIYILAFIALISVVFGVSMHEAFWGIIAFIVLTLIAGIIIFLLKMLGIRIGNKINYLKTPQGKKEIKQKERNFFKGLLIIFIWIIIFSPLVLELVFHQYLKDFTASNELAVFIISFAPITILAITSIFYLKDIIKNATKKRTK